jgi:hypothetical protein
VVARLAPRPLLIVHGAQNALHKPVEAHPSPRVVGLLDEFLTSVWSPDAGQNGRGGPRDDYAARQ